MKRLALVLCLLASPALAEPNACATSILPALETAKAKGEAAFEAMRKTSTLEVATRVSRQATRDAIVAAAKASPLCSHVDVYTVRGMVEELPR